MSQSTYLKMLVEDRLGVELNSWLRTRAKQRLSVRKIADEIEKETGIKVSKSVVHNWL